MSNQNIEKRETPKWRERIKYRKENKKWLSYSGKIALRILAAMEDLPGMNQKRLAELSNVTPQHISKMLKGEDNMTLETIAKMSEILMAELISFPDYKYNQPLKSFVAFETHSGFIFMSVPMASCVYMDKSFIFPYEENLNFNFTYNSLTEDSSQVF